MVRSASAAFALLIFCSVELAYCKVDYTSPSCQGRCSLFAMQEDKPTCQCDEGCLTQQDCCQDYLAVCLKLIKVVPSTELVAKVGAIVGTVCLVVIVMAGCYYYNLKKREIRTIDASLDDFTMTSSRRDSRSKP